MKTSARSLLWRQITPIAAILSGGFGTCALAQQPVITSFDLDGSLTWSNAYSNAVASIERLTDGTTTGSAVTVTETLGVSDGSTAVYSYTVEHPPIVNPSVTIDDGTYSWNDETGYSTNPPGFIGWAEYLAGTVHADYPSQPPPAGTPIEVEYSYLPVSITQEWLSVYSEPATGNVAQATVSMSEEISLFRAVNVPSTMVLIPGGSNIGTNPLGIHSDPLIGPESHDFCYYPATYSLSLDSFYMDRYEVTNDEMVRVMQWSYDNSRILVSDNGVHSLQGDQSRILLGVHISSCRIMWDGSRFEMKAEKASGYPCVNVSWYGAVAYCNYRSEMEGRTPCYDLSDWSCNLGANGYRLPMEREWEYAARGGLTSKRFPWGDTISHSQANYLAFGELDYDLSSDGWHPTYGAGERPYTSPVGAFAASGYGLYDMAGNVAEWCNDLHPCDPVYGVYKGGTTAETTRIANHGQNITPSYIVGSELGFRTVLPAGQ